MVLAGGEINFIWFSLGVVHFYTAGAQRLPQL